MYIISSVLGTSMSEKSQHKSVPTQEKRVAGIGMSERKLATYSRVADMSPTFPAKSSTINPKHYLTLLQNNIIAQRPQPPTPNLRRVHHGLSYINLVGKSDRNSVNSGGIPNSGPFF